MSKKDKLSNSMKDRHRQAKLKYDQYKKVYPLRQDVKYYDFLRNKENNPFDNNIISYEVSFQVSYRGSVDTIEMTKPSTFIVYGFKGQENEIESRTINMVLDSKGTSSGLHFNPNALKSVSNSTDIKITPRGIEGSNRKPTQSDINNLLTDRYVVKELDNAYKFKNKKGSTGDMKLDLNHFI